VILHGLSGQAIGPARYLAVLVRYRLASKTLTVPERPDKLGLVLDAAPAPSAEPARDEPGLLPGLEELQA
jgi:hypothetical protein